MKQKIEKIQKNLEKNQAVLIFDNSNRFYFTGFSSSAGVVVIAPQKAIFLIDFRYFEKAKKTVKSAETVLCNNLYSQLTVLLKELNITEIFLETDSVNLSVYARLCDVLEGVTVHKDDKIQKLITKLRFIKDKNEIDFIKSAQEITDKTFEHILNSIKIGKTEKKIALEMEFFARQNGSDGIAFDFIVVSGKNSSLPHGVPTDKTIANGDFITMDFGARFNGYCSDMTRTVAIGDITEKQKFVYDTVLKAQELAFKEIKPTAICKDIDAVARNFINANGFEGKFGHGLGHSLGLDIHESPSFNTRDMTPLKSGMILTVEPGIYLEDEFGVRIEDMALITDNGYENLTKSPKELIML